MINFTDAFIKIASKYSNLLIRNISKIMLRIPI